jgi:metal-sulfur cluster biosynthetic enzyme
MSAITKKDFEAALSQIMHPEINASLVQLGMLQKIKLQNKTLSLTLKVPFLGIPIKTALINSIQETLKTLAPDYTPLIETAEMTEKEKEKFLQMAQKNWKL